MLILVCLHTKYRVEIFYWVTEICRISATFIRQILDNFEEV